MTQLTLAKALNTGLRRALADDDGVTVEAEEVFIQPRWARG